MTRPPGETAPLVSDAVELLRRHVGNRPDHLAVDFAPTWQGPAESLTYGELDLRARTVAARLLQRFPSGSRLMIAEPPGLGFVAAFFGCLYAGMIAAPVAVPRRAGTDEVERFEHVARDSGCAAILAPAETAARLAALPELTALMQRLWLDPHEPGPPLAGPLPADPEQVAFLQYTSGSTGDPKGVMVRHRNIAHNVHRIMVRCRLDPQSRALIWLPHFHDLGLVGGILTPLYTGFPTTLMSPLQFAKRPLDWLRLVSAGRYTISGGPNFAFRLCLERFDAERLQGVDLSSWSCAFNCAEQIDAETVDRFAEVLAPWGFRKAAIYPCYGMAEATLTIASHPGQRTPLVYEADAEALETQRRARPAQPGGRVRKLIGVGQAAPDQTTVIVDPVSLTELDEHEVGEICTADDSVTAGYWNRPDDTRRMFLRLPGRPGLKFLRTGDLGFLDRGELFVTGRLKDLIIVDGRNVHPEDLEATTRAAADVGAALAVVAFAAQREGAGERLVILLEVERARAGQLDEAGIRARVQAALSIRHEVRAEEILVVCAGQVPRTTSGKVRRRQTQALHASEALQSATAFTRRARTETG